MENGANSRWSQVKIPPSTRPMQRCSVIRGSAACREPCRLAPISARTAAPLSRHAYQVHARALLQDDDEDGSSNDVPPAGMDKHGGKRKRSSHGTWSCPHGRCHAHNPDTMQLLTAALRGAAAVPAVSPENQVQGYRSDNSLGALTQQYMRLLKTSVPEMLDRNKAAAALKVRIHADGAWHHHIVTAAPGLTAASFWHGLLFKARILLAQMAGWHACSYWAG